jgi:hypothetical protein
LTAPLIAIAIVAGPARSGSAEVSVFCDKSIQTDPHLARLSQPGIAVGSNFPGGEMVMLRKMIIALFAIGSIGMLMPDSASARGGGGVGHGGGAAHFGGGFGGPHPGGGFHGRGFGLGGPGYGFYGPYGYYDDPSYGDDYYADGGCYLVRQRIHTRHGWRLRTVEVCD